MHRPAIEPRKSPILGADTVHMVEGNTSERVIASAGRPGVVRDPGMCRRSLRGNREISRSTCKAAFEVSWGEVERPMTAPENRAVTVLLTEEHVRRMIEYHLLKEDEISDPVKLSRVVRKSLDTALGLPDLPWHDWDEWGKG